MKEYIIKKIIFLLIIHIAIFSCAKKIAVTEPVKSLSIAKDYAIMLEIYGGKDISAEGLEAASSIEVTHYDPSGNTHVYYLDASYSDGETDTEGNELYTKHPITALYGTVLTLKAKPSLIHHFKRFEGNVTFISDDAITIHVKSDKILVRSYFAIDPYQSDRPYIDGDTYEVRTPLHLEWIANHFDVENGYEGKTVKLINDIDMSLALDFSGIAGNNPNKKFNGIFEGNGHTVSGLNIISTTDYTGFIGSLGENGVVRNLKVVGNIEGNNYTGSIVGYNYGSIENVESRVSVNGANYTGGITGYSLGNIINAKQYGQVSGDDFTAGIVGFARSSISQVEFSGDVVGKYYTAGIVGLIVGDISKATTTGTIKGEHYTAGIVASNKGSVSMVSNAATITGENYTSGISGYNHGNIIYATNIGAVTGKDLVGSIAGYNRGDIKNSYNGLTGIVNANEIVGGLVGYHFLGTLSEAINRGAVNGQATVGGLVGENSGIILNANNSAGISASATLSILGGVAGKNGGLIKNSYNAGRITGKDGVGGVSGINYGAIEDAPNGIGNTGTISGVNNVGGIIGVNYGSIENSLNGGGAPTGTDAVGDLIGLNYSKTINTTTKASRSLRIPSIGKNAF